MSMFRSIVCVKAVPDPESPSSAFEIDPVAKEMIPIGVPPVINPFDENALELALRLKDAVGGKVTAITVAEKSIATVNHKIKTASDDFYLLTDAVFKDLDSRSIACVLERAIRNAGDFDLIITGRQAADWGFGQVGPMLATMLDIPCISLAISARVEGRSIIVEKLKRNGYETVKAQLPVLLTATSEIGDLRLFSLRDIKDCLLYTSDAADDPLCVDLGGRRSIKKKKNNHLPTLPNHTSSNPHTPILLPTQPPVPI